MSQNVPECPNLSIGDRFAAPVPSERSESKVPVLSERSESKSRRKTKPLSILHLSSATLVIPYAQYHVPIPAAHPYNPPMSSAAPAHRTLRVRHVTRYSYDQPVARSIHRLHLRPVTDFRQRVLSHTLDIDPDAPRVEFEDVFGNWSARFELNQPYTHLTIAAESIVEVTDTNPFAFALLPIRPASYPLVWMPWERTMLAPYLTPVELPDTQLQELTDYAMSYVRRNNFDLMETLFALNLALYHDFKYTPSCTDLDTTPFQVYLTRRGVCQDFANLFITMARLIGIPARYVCGYLFTGNNHETRAQSDASHAWVQLYIPNIGWKDFDPTNGVLPQTDHVRVAYGRHYRDATPTMGTLYGSSPERMTIEVTVEDANAPVQA